MIKSLLILEWKAFFRSAGLGKSIGLKVLMIFIALYFTAAFVIVGVGLYPLILKYFPGEVPILFVNKYILLWLGAEFAYRFFLQALPVLDIKPLLILPIKKKKVVHFVLLKSLNSFFNFLPLFIIIPFGIFNIYKSEWAVISIIAWMLAIIALSLSVNYANFIFKKTFTDNFKSLVPFIALAVALIFLSYLGIFNSNEYFGYGLDRLLINPILTLIPFTILIAMYFWNAKLLLSKFYLDDSLREKTKKISTREFLWTRHFGELAPYLQQDLKLIWRNKRPKSLIFLSSIFLAYGLMVYPNGNINDLPSFSVFVGIFMSGVFMMNFGQFIPAWDAEYYQLIMTQNIPIKKYLTAKSILVNLSVIILAILATPYVFFGWKVFALNLACAVYNIGVNTPLLLYAGSFNRKRVDLEKGPFLNYQGTGASQFLIFLPLLVIPTFMFWFLFNQLSFEIATTFLFGIGAVGILFKNQVMEFIAVVYKRKKYEMIEGFKQKGN